jgi:transposase
VQNATFWRALLGVEKTVVEEIEFDEDEQVLVADVRPGKRARGRCGRCQRRSPAFDRGEGRRRWRALDLGTVQVLLEAESLRVNSREHGKSAVPIPPMSSAGPPTRSTRSAARRGTRPVAPSPGAGPGGPVVRRRRSSTPGSRCGRTPRA